MTSPGVTGLIAFLATLATVVLLSKIGGSGADLAIMTGLVGILGMLAPGLVPSRGKDSPTRRVKIDQPPDEPIPVEEK